MSTKEGYGLKSTCLSFLEILSQSVANISPTLTPVVIVPFVFASAGNGTWLTYLVATAALMLVGMSINEFAKRSASPGALCAAITFLFAALFGWLGLGVLDIFNDFSTIATFGFLIVYILVSIAAPVYLKSLGALKPINIVVSTVSIVLMLLPLIAAFYPVPAPPADKFPIYFGIYLLAGILWFAWLRFKSSHVVSTMRDDLKSVRDRFKAESELERGESGLIKAGYPAEGSADPAA